MLLERRYHAFQGGLGRPIHGVYGDVRESIDGVALIDEVRQDLARISLLQEWPIVPAQHPLMQQIEIGTQPDRDAALADVGPRLSIHEGAAARCEDMHGIAEQPGDDLALAFAEHRLAAPLEDLLDG